jgi:hypothetical protein
MMRAFISRARPRGSKSAFANSAGEARLRFIPGRRPGPLSGSRRAGRLLRPPCADCPYDRTLRDAGRSALQQRKPDPRRA